ncbi:YwdI family protein [Fredinandcohnia sp. QZ13]|uniref:YwdI family protein n=1 Tax=Fredinandcohnia sp. QZ13 TaxID=3073144 RepID=UPI0028530CA8|nr:YwdI family protein [Fredinandcohnia sp. QZ13]MDR4890298.1 YwdI family protein [Fredinandcohnia sp. QZ13]
MNISVGKILDKMQQELQMAKSEASEQKVRERLMAIRTLCDLVLDEAPAEVRRVETVPVQPMPKVVQPIQTMQPTTIQNSTKLEEDDANGDSLFDF